ncbi:MAG: ATPase domain-containing protein [Ignisphaera sp.]
MLSIGVEALDQLLPNIMASNTLLVIAGHPGSGKTTLAISTCYHNASNNNAKCLYVSLQENKDKLYRVAKKLGMNLEYLESVGRFRFLKIPITSNEDMVLEIIDAINRAVYDFSPLIIVVDSITPLLRAIESNIKARAILQNYFYELPSQVNGVVILVAEVPFYMDRIELGDIEFVADAVLILRHRIDGNLLVRELEIRKARGSPITIARLPFSIVEGSGIRIYTPVRLEEVPDIRWDKRFKQPCQLFQNVIGDYYGGEIIYIEYPLYTRPLRIFLYGLALIVANRARTIIFSYKTSPKQLTGLVQHLLARYGIDIDVNRLLDKTIELGFISLVSLNPSAYSVEELYYRELLEIERFKPDIAMFMDVDVISYRDRTYFNLLRNQLLYLKKMGILTVRFGVRSREPDYLSLILADSIVRNLIHRRGESIERDIYVTRVGREPSIVEHEEANKCIEECINILGGLKDLPKVYSP